MAGNLPLGFAEFALGAIFITAGITDSSIGDVISGKAYLNRGSDDPGKGNPSVRSPTGGGANVISSSKGNPNLLQRLVSEATKKYGLKVTSTTGGSHVAGSYHYQGRAVDLSGPPAMMAAFFRFAKQFRPTELFYDPEGAIKNGKAITPIGGHSDHVHIAF